MQGLRGEVVIERLNSAVYSLAARLSQNWAGIAENCFFQIFFAWRSSWGLFRFEPVGSHAFSSSQRNLSARHAPVWKGSIGSRVLAHR